MGTSIRYTPSDCFQTFPLTAPAKDKALGEIGRRYELCRREIMSRRQEGMTNSYNRFHGPDESSTDIQKLRELHVEMDHAVAAAYGWTDLDLRHSFHETKQGLRYTISEAARREVLDWLLALNHERHAEELASAPPEKKKRAGRKKSAAQNTLF